MKHVKQAVAAGYALPGPGRHDRLPLWVSDVLPGGTRDITAARELVLPGLRPYLEIPACASRIRLRRRRCRCARSSEKACRRSRPRRGHKARNALLRSLHHQGERGLALMSDRCRALQHVMLSPGKIGDIAETVLVLLEHKMIT